MNTLLTFMDVLQETEAPPSKRKKLQSNSYAILAKLHKHIIRLDTKSKPVGNKTFSVEGDLHTNAMANRFTVSLQHSYFCAITDPTPGRAKQGPPLI